MRHWCDAFNLGKRDCGELARQMEYEQNALGLRWHATLLLLEVENRGFCLCEIILGGQRCDALNPKGG
jgi:hypothetical protein